MEIRGRKSRTFCFRKTSFVHSRSGTYYALLRGCFGLKFLPDVVTVSTDFWLRFEAQTRPTRLAINFLLTTARAERKVRLCAKLFDFFRGRIRIRFTSNLSRFVPNSVEILTWNFRKKLFLENFSKILCQPRFSSFETCEISPYFRQFLFWVLIALKRFTQELPYVVCIQVRRDVNKIITKRRYGPKISRTICLRKSSSVHSRSGTYYALLLGCFRLKFLPDVVTVSIEFWLRFEAQIRPIKLAINLLLIIARAERKVRLCAKLFDFFRGRILIRLT